MASETSKVTAVVTSFAETWNRHDMAAFGQLFVMDAEFVNVVGLWWKGRRAIQSAHEFSHSGMFKNSRLTITATEVRFPVKEVAIARSTWLLEGHVTPEGEALPPRRGILVNILEQTAAGWKIIDTQNTDIVDGAMTQPQ
jgi:uncharacterized protein (TIGR02246 family)